MAPLEKPRSQKWKQEEKHEKQSRFFWCKPFHHLSLFSVLSSPSCIPLSSSSRLCLIPPSPPALLPLCSSPAFSPPLSPPHRAAIGQLSTNHNRSGAWGTAYAKLCLIFMSSYRGFKSLIRTAAQLSVPTARPAGRECVCSLAPWLSHPHARTHTLPHSCAHTQSRSVKAAHSLVIVFLPPSGKKDRGRPEKEEKKKEETYTKLCFVYFSLFIVCLCFFGGGWHDNDPLSSMDSVGRPLSECLFMHSEQE